MNGVFMLQMSRADRRKHQEAALAFLDGERQALEVRLDPLSARAWRLLRIRKKLSTAEAVGLLCDGKDDAKALRRATGVVGRYLRTLRLAGYVQTLPAKNPRLGKRYVLIRDTGPGAPFVRVRGGMFDPNEGLFYAFVA